MASRRTKLIVAAAVILGAAVLWLALHRTRPAPIVTPGSLTPARGGALVATMRTDPASYDRYVTAGATAATEVVTLLTQAKLVRLNRVTDDLEPWLAESWTLSPDGLTATLKLREGLVFSDGVPFSAEDVLFAFAAAYDPRVKSPVGESMKVGGAPLQVSAPDASTIQIRFPAPFAPGVRLLDNLPILPRHKLAAALEAGRLSDEWTPAHPVSDVAGLGPFILTEHISGQRLVFTRNPHYFRRDAAGTQLPYLDTLTIQIVPDQNTEALRLQAGEVDLLANAEVRPEDYAAVKRLAREGRLRLLDVGIGLDPNLLWFNLSGSAPSSGGRALVRQKAFRQAVSFGVDRQALANTVYLGAAVPVFGPVSPGNIKWYSADVPAYPYDAGKARALLASLGLADRNGDGLLETGSGTPARFSMLAQAGNIRARTAAAIVEQLRQLGIGVDLVTLDPPAIFARYSKGDYDSIYHGVQASSTDPALNMDFWLSSGTFHFWNPGQPEPATAWEARIDELMQQQARTADPAARQRAFAEVQRIMGEEVPAISFVAPRVWVATSPRVVSATPALQGPQFLWSADTLAVAR